MPAALIFAPKRAAPAGTACARPGPRADSPDCRPVRQAEPRPRYLGAVLAALLLGGVSHAQTLPGPVAPGQIEKRFEPLPEPQALPELTLPLPEGRKLDAKAAEQVIPLKQVELTGNTAIPGDELAVLWEGMLGETVSLAQLVDLADRITVHYRNAGYILTRVVIPEQRVTDGTVRLRVIESYIAAHEIAGKVPPGTERLLDEWAERIKASRPLHISVLEHHLLLADNLPGLKVQGRVTADPDGEAGASILTLLVEPKPWDLRFQLDNHGSKTIGPHQAFFAATRHGLFTPYGSSTLALSTAEDTDELHYLHLAHEQLVGTRGTRLRIGLTAVDSEPGEALAVLDTKTRTRSAELGFIHPLDYSRGARTDLYGGFAWRRFRSESLGERLSADDLRVLHLGLRTDFADRFAGLTLLDGALHVGLDAFGASRTGDPNLSRADAGGRFAKLTGQAVRIQPFAAGWSLYTVAAFQYAFDELLSSEEFSFGGGSVGRAYDPSELTGDHGLSGLLELRYHRQLENPLVASIQPFAFYDVGAVWQKGGGSDSRQSGASGGLGVRLTFSDNVDAGLYVAKPLTRPSAEGEGSRVFFNISARY